MLTQRPVSAPYQDITLSIVIPIYNEEDVIATLHRRLKSTLDAVSISYEVIFVNDGSTDRSAELLDQINQQDGRFRTLHLARNFGHQIAITAGLDYASGDAVMIMDADLQDPPELIAQFLEKWREGYEVVYAIRRNRKENLLKRASYTSFYWLLQRLTPIDIPLHSGDFGLIDKRVVQAMRELPERNRFVRGLRSWIGFRQIGVEYERQSRFAGEVKYTLSKLLKLAFDGIFSFSYAPLRLATYLGFSVSSLSFILGIVYLIQKITIGIQPEGWASTMVVILFLGGVQLLTIGIIGEYIGRIYDEVKERPIYLIKRSAGFDQLDRSFNTQQHHHKA